jgi:hypothetical protein
MKGAAVSEDRLCLSDLGLETYGKLRLCGDSRVV